MEASHQLSYGRTQLRRRAVGIGESDRPGTVGRGKGRGRKRFKDLNYAGTSQFNRVQALIDRQSDGGLDSWRTISGSVTSSGRPKSTKCVGDPLNWPLAEKQLSRCGSLVGRQVCARRDYEAHRLATAVEGRSPPPRRKFSKPLSGLDNCDRTENWSFSTQSTRSCSAPGTKRKRQQRASRSTARDRGRFGRNSKPTSGCGSRNVTANQLDEASGGLRPSGADGEMKVRSSAGCSVNRPWAIL